MSPNKFWHQNAERNNNTGTDNETLKNVTKFIYLGTSSNQIAFTKTTRAD
jgi:hypothetical protein